MQPYIANQVTAAPILAVRYVDGVGSSVSVEGREWAVSVAPGFAKAILDDFHASNAREFKGRYYLVLPECGIGGGHYQWIRAEQFRELYRKPPAVRDTQPAERTKPVPGLLTGEAMTRVTPLRVDDRGQLSKEYTLGPRTVKAAYISSISNTFGNGLLTLVDGSNVWVSHEIANPVLNEINLPVRDVPVGGKYVLVRDIIDGKTVGETIVKAADFERDFTEQVEGVK